MPRVVVLVEGNRNAIGELLESPWKEFFNELSEIGNLEFSASNIHSDDVVISFGNPPDLESALHVVPPELNRLHVVVREAPSIRPDWYRKSFLRKFDYRWAPSPVLAKRINGRAYVWPQHIPESKPIFNLDEWALRSDTASLLLANKYSAVKGDLYWIRRDLVSRASNEGRHLDVFGSSWSQSSFGKYREIISACNQTISCGNFPIVKIRDLTFSTRRLGSSVRQIGHVPNKYATLQGYKWTFVPENNAEWVTEKLIDALVAGAIPIYCGANLSDIGLPSNLCLTTIPDASEMWKTLDGLKRKDVRELLDIRNRALEIVYSDSFIEEFRNDNSLRKLGSEIKKAVLSGHC